MNINGFFLYELLTLHFKKIIHIEIILLELAINNLNIDLGFLVNFAKNISV